MIKVIQYSLLKLILFFCLLLNLTSCTDSKKETLASYKTRNLILSDGTIIKAYLADTTLKQAKGLSGIKESDFNKSEAVFFDGSYQKPRQFWMPGTFFDLDIIFLSADLYVLDIHRNLQHFEKFEPRSLVPMSKKVLCTHVLEIAANSALSEKIQPGMMLKWETRP